GRLALQSGLVAHHEDPGSLHYRDLGLLESTRVGGPAQPRSRPNEPEVPRRAASLSAIRRLVQPALTISASTLASVWRWTLDGIDHQHLHRTTRWFKPQSKLLLKRSKDGRGIAVRRTRAYI